MSTACPRCGSRYLHPSRKRNFSEKLGTLRLTSPYRCLDCKLRFFAPSIVWRDLFFAQCPGCYRMDLNSWTGKTYMDPPFWIKLKVGLGARKWRCEYCRLNFASFRSRKEVFTFKRWKQFGQPAEEHPLDTRPSDANKAKRQRVPANAEPDGSFKAGA